MFCPGYCGGRSCHGCGPDPVGCCGELIAYSTRSRGKGTVLLYLSGTRIPTDSDPILAEHRAPVHSFMPSAPSVCPVARVAGARLCLLPRSRAEEHPSAPQSFFDLVC